MPGIALRSGDTKMGECTRQTCACCLGVYILVMIKLVGFIGISFLANKYLLSIYSLPGTWNIIIHQIDTPHGLVNLTN